MPRASITPRWAPYPDAARYSGLSTRLLEDLVKDDLVTSALVRRPGCARGVRLIDLRSLDSYIENGIGGKSDMSVLQRGSQEKGGNA
jgi:hypothetical protein